MLRAARPAPPDRPAPIDLLPSPAQPALFPLISPDATAVMPLLSTAPALASRAELEATLEAVEAQLSGLGAALLARDGDAIDAHAAELPRALARAVVHFSAAAQRGPVPPALRQRLSRASSVVAAQRESFARATAALDRAIDVLLPREAGVYNALGTTDRGLRGGSIRA